MVSGSFYSGIIALLVLAADFLPPWYYGMISHHPFASVEFHHLGLHLMHL